MNVIEKRSKSNCRGAILETDLEWESYVYI